MPKSIVPSSDDKPVWKRIDYVGKDIPILGKDGKKYELLIPHVKVKEGDRLLGYKGKIIAIDHSPNRRLISSIGGASLPEIYLFLINPNGHLFVFRLNIENNDFTITSVNKDIVSPFLSIVGDSSLLTVQSNSIYNLHQVRLPVFSPLGPGEFGSNTYRPGIAGYFQMECTDCPIVWRGYGQVRIVSTYEGSEYVRIGFPFPYMPLDFAEGSPYVWIEEDPSDLESGWKGQYNLFKQQAISVKVGAVDKGTGRRYFITMDNKVSKRFITIFEKINLDGEGNPIMSDFFLGYETSAGVEWTQLQSIGGYSTTEIMAYGEGTSSTVESNTGGENSSSYITTITWTLGALETTTPDPIAIPVEYYAPISDISIAMEDTTINVKTSVDASSIQSNAVAGQISTTQGTDVTYISYCRLYSDPINPVIETRSHGINESIVTEDYLFIISDTEIITTRELSVGEYMLENLISTETIHEESTKIIKKVSNWHIASSSTTYYTYLDGIIPGSSSHAVIESCTAYYTGDVSGRIFEDIAVPYSYTYFLDISNYESEDNTIDILWDYDHTQNGNWVMVYSLLKETLSLEEEIARAPGILTTPINGDCEGFFLPALRLDASTGLIPHITKQKQDVSQTYSFILTYKIGNSVFKKTIATYTNSSGIEYGPDGNMVEGSQYNTPSVGQDITGVSCKISGNYMTYTYIIRGCVGDDGNNREFNKRVIGVVNINDSNLPIGYVKEFEITEGNEEEMLAIYNNPHYKDIAAIGLHMYM